MKSQRRVRPEFTLWQLLVFRTVVERRGFSSAANRLRISQPAVSFSVAQLEQAMGLPLLRRKGRKMVPTPEGRAVYERAAKVAQLVTELQLSVADVDQGILSIGAGATAGIFIVSELLATFKREHPGIEVRLRIGNTTDLLPALESGDCDVVIISGPVDGRVGSAKLGSGEVVVIASPTHNLVGQARIPLERLADETWILREPNSWSRSALETLLKRANVRLERTMEISYNEAVREAVRHGLGLALASRLEVGQETDAGRLAILDVEGFPMQFDWRVCWDADQTSRLVDAFVRFLLVGAPPLGVDGEQHAVRWTRSGNTAERQLNGEHATP